MLEISNRHSFTMGHPIQLFLDQFKFRKPGYRATCDIISTVQCHGLVVTADTIQSTIVY